MMPILIKNGYKNGFQQIRRVMSLKKKQYSYIWTQSETACFRHTHQVKISKMNTEVHEIEYYLE